MMKKIFLVMIVGLLTLDGLSVMGANDASDEARIKHIIKKAFIIETRAKSKEVEFDGQKYASKSSQEVIAELSEYASNKSGYISHLEEAHNFIAINERLYNARVEKTRFKDFDFKSVIIDGDNATVGVDVYWEVVDHTGAQTSVIFRPDDNGIQEVHETPEKNVVFNGIHNCTIALEKSDSRWRILSKECQF